MCGICAKAECMLSLVVFKNWRSLKCECAVQIVITFNLSCDYRKLWRHCVAGEKDGWRAPSPWTPSRNTVTFLWSSMKVFNSIQVDYNPAKKGKFMWSWSAIFLAFPAEPQTICSVTGIIWLWVKLSMPASAEQAKERGPAGQEGKVWQSDVVLLTGNIRQRRPLQINVQQVLGV